MMFGRLHQQMIHLLCRHSGCQIVACGTTCSSSYSSYSYTGIESSKYMQKLLTKRGAKTKRKWYQPHIAEPMELSGKPQRPNKKGVSQAQGHRSRQLSHVLYARICQIANSGELSNEVLNKQVFFTRVKMHPTFSGINVYWDGNRSDAADIDNLLMGLSGKLRSLLISYHVLGRIPTITFVKDQSKSDLARLNQLFEVADYGPDYVPSSQNSEDANISLSDNITTGTQRNVSDTLLNEGLSALKLEHPKVYTSISSNTCSVEHPDTSNTGVSDSLDDLSSEAGWQQYGLSANESSEKIPPEDPFSFRSDLYGLPRDTLMKKVMAQKKKTKYQKPEGVDESLDSSSDLQFKDYAKLRSKLRDKEKMIQKRDSTKMKQRLLEQEFEEVQESLMARSTDSSGFDRDIDHEYDDYETHNRT